MPMLYPPAALAGQLVHANAERITEAACGVLDPSEWVQLDARDSFIETVDPSEMPPEARALDGYAAVRLAVVGEGFTLLALYTSAADVPSRPATYEWVLPDRERISALCETFPALHGAPGVRPFHVATLATWAASAGTQAACAAALVIELGAGLAHECGGPVDRLFESVAGLAHARAEVFDVEHLAAASAALRAFEREVKPPPPPVVEEVEEEEPAVVQREARTVAAYNARAAGRRAPSGMAQASAA